MANLFLVGDIIGSVDDMPVKYESFETFVKEQLSEGETIACDKVVTMFDEWTSYADAVCVDYPMLREIINPGEDWVVVIGDVGYVHSFYGIGEDHILYISRSAPEVDSLGTRGGGAVPFPGTLEKADIEHIFDCKSNFLSDNDAIKCLREFLSENCENVIWHRGRLSNETKCECSIYKENKFFRKLLSRFMNQQKCCDREYWCELKRMLGFGGRRGNDLILYRRKASDSLGTSEKEYETVRMQILQYMDKYQTVRNMMYIITVTILGFAAGDGMDQIQYLFLVPLIVILPSALLHQDYHKGVVRAGAYLQVFHEGQNNSNHHWETRTRATRLLGRKRSSFVEFIKRIFWRNNGQDLCYVACAIACLGLYFVPIKRTICETGTFPRWPIMIGVAALAVTAGVFLMPEKVDSDKFLMDFDKIENPKQVKHRDDEKTEKN